MTKTQTQLPEAARPQNGPEELPAENTEWKPPSTSKVGWKAFSAAQLRDAAFADSDLRLRHDGVRHGQLEGLRRIWVQEGMESHLVSERSWPSR